VGLGEAGLPLPKIEPKKLPTDPKKLLPAGGFDPAAAVSEVGAVPPDDGVVSGGRVSLANNPPCNGHCCVGSVPVR